MLDVGADAGVGAIVEQADSVLLVVDASAVGIVRAAQVTSQWMGPQPLLVLNRVDASNRTEVVDAARRWTGLEPAAVVLERRQVRRTTAAAKMPDKRFVRAVAGVGAMS